MVVYKPVGVDSTNKFPPRVDAAIKNRANHTGTQLASTISDLQAVVSTMVADALNGGATPVAGLPTVPTSVLAPAGDTIITPSWQPPTSNGGSAITGYKVYRTLPDWVTNPPLGSAARSYQLTNFINGTVYAVGVSAVNANGESPIAWVYNITPQGAVAPPASNLPGYPTNVTVLIGDTKLTPSWAPPSTTGGSAITGYKVYRDNPTGNSGTLASTVRTLEISGLTNGTSYTIGVSAINANGEGPVFSVSGQIPASGAVAPVTPITSAGLATKVASAWYHSWQLPLLRDIPATPKGTLNHYVIAMAQSGGTGTGNIAFSPNNGQTQAAMIADIDAIRTAGKTVVMGFGGSSDGGITITNTTQENQAFNSLVTLIDTYHLDGIDIDLEPSGSSWTVASVSNVCTRLVTKYGTGFIIGITPSLYDPYTANWMTLAQTLGSKMTYMAPMLYDFPEAADSRLNSVTVQKIDIMANAGIPRSKMIMGYMCVPPEGRANTSTATVALNAYKYAEAQRPGIRGAFIWETYIEGRQNYQWTTTSGAYIRSTG